MQPLFARYATPSVPIIPNAVTATSFVATPLAMTTSDARGAVNVKFNAGILPNAVVTFDATGLDSGRADAVLASR